MNNLDLFGDEQMFVSLDSTGYISDVDLRAMACEDDVESTCPLIGMLPAESDHEGGSPLDFGETSSRPIGFRLVSRTKPRRRRLKSSELRRAQFEEESKLRGHLR
jgi:hypothetical protein